MHRRSALAACVAPGLSGPMPTHASAVQPQAFSYGPSPSQVADLYLPQRPRPAVVALLHGGFWKAAYGREQLGAVAVDLCRHGFAVWNIGYRRVGEAGGGWPGTLDDVAGALAHLHHRRVQAAWPLDLDRLVVAGHSAGGQLALACTAGRAPQGPGSGRVRVTGIVGLAALTDLYAAQAEGIGSGAVSAFLGGTPAEHPTRYADASPASRLPHGATLRLLHGTQDDAVPIAQSRAYATAARRAGDDAVCVDLEGAGHMDFLDPASGAHAALRRQLDALTTAR